jgi:flagellar FliJ protein
VKRFRFALERLLQLRSYKEQEWQARLAVVTGACLKLGGKIEENDRQAALTFSKSCYHEEKLDFNRMVTREMYINRLQFENKGLGKKLAVKNREREDVQKHYLTASRDRKVINKLKERRQIEHYRRERAEDFKVMDEVTSGSRARKKIKDA